MNTRTTWAGPIAVGATLTGTLMIVIMHVLLHRQVDAQRDPISSYLAEPSGDTWFALGCASLAVACVALILGSLPAEAMARWWLGGAALALILVTAFHPDVTERMALASQIHRYSAGVVFFMITGAAATVWYPRRGTLAGRILGFLTLLAAVTMILSAIYTLSPNAAEALPWRGVVQRVMLGAHLVVLVMLPYLPAPTRHTRAAHARSRPARTLPRAGIGVMEPARLRLMGRDGPGHGT